MNISTSRNSLLAAIALTGLAVYILACASFSPDDAKVAFPSFDAHSGELGISVLDRKSGQAETVFSLSVIGELAKPGYEARLLRSQWLDNKRLIVGWPGVQDEKKGLNVLVLPVGGKGAVRLWQIADLGKMSETLIRPLAVAGSGLFVAAESNRVARLDLETGRVVSHLCSGEAIMLYPSGQDDYVFYAARVVGEKDKLECGKLNAATFAQTPWLQMDSALTSGEEQMAFGAEGRQVAFVTEKAGKCLLRIARAGQAEQTIPVSVGDEKLALGGLCFSAKGDTVFASLGRQSGTNVSFGLVEIPLGGRPAQRTDLFPGPNNADLDSVLYLQPALSHDGKTIAMASTYLFGEPGATGASGCALFLVDLSRTPHKVSQVPVALPQMNHPFK